jgi:phytoene dehydrogenase-like protein
MCVADWLDEWFGDDLLKTALALPAVAGSWTGPWSPGTAAILLLRETTGAGGVVGGPAALVAALVAAARAAAIDVRTGAEVRRIVVAGGRVAGVTLGDGTALAAPLVAASCDPRRTLLELLPHGAIELRLERRLQGYRCRGTTAHVALALDRPPRFSAAPEGPFAFARSGAHLDDLERAFDAVKYRRMSEQPALEIHLPSVTDATLAPPGHAVASILVHFAPHDLAGGWNDGRRDELYDRVLAVLERHAPGIGRSVVGRRVLTPLDLEREYGLTGGQLHHGEQGLDQLLVRPAPECFGYRTPVEGLWLCGSGSHPGGGLTGAPGLLAAAAMLGARSPSPARA